MIKKAYKDSEWCYMEQKMKEQEGKEKGQEEEGRRRGFSISTSMLQGGLT